MQRWFQIVLAAGLIFCSANVSAGPDMAILCERQMIHSPLFTPGSEADHAHVVTVFDLRPQYCYPSIDSIYAQHRIPEWPVIAYTPELVDINAVSILGIFKDELESNDTKLVLYFDMPTLRKAIKEAAYIHDKTEFPVEIINVINVLFAAEKQYGERDDNTKFIVNMSKSDYAEIGLTTEALEKLNGQLQFK